MVQQKLRVDGLTCGSCEKVIKKAVGQEAGVTSVQVDVDQGEVTITHNPEVTPLDRIVEIIRSKGYVVGLPSSNEPRRFSFHSSLSSSKQKASKASLASFPVEKKMLATAVLTFFVLLILMCIAYLAFFKSIDGFLPKYGVYITYLIIGVIANAAAIWHIRCYRQHVDCISGMMIGMTLGMMSGFMGGAIVGATNGMFIGAIYGMAIGMAVGVWCGKCCGIMGTMEGLMAGLMGGTMGAMLSVMLLADHILIFLALLFLACLTILGGLSYMILEKHGPAEADHDVYDMSMFMLLCYVITFITSLIMIYGPKSILVQ